MKKLLIPFLLLCMLLTGCAFMAAPEQTLPDITDPSVPADTTQQATEETADVSAPTPSQLPMAAVAVPTVTEQSEASDGTTLFTFTYQNMSLTLPDPEVADKVILDFLNRVDSRKASAENIKTQAYSDYKNASSWTPYMFRVTYDPMRIDHGVLSLFGSVVSYSGTPHPENLRLSANYDLVNGEVLTLANILTDKCTKDTLSTLLQDALDEIAQEKNLYPDYVDIAMDRLSSDWISDEDWFFSTEGLCFYFSPYQIAPYASGVIVAQIPYASLTGLLNDAYFPAEQDAYDSAITAEPFEKADLNSFTQFSEIVLHKDANKIILHADLPVYDIRLEEGSFIPGSTEFTVSNVVFAASSLTPGDAIMIEAEIDAQTPTLRICYRSGGIMEQAFLGLDGDTVTLTAP